MNCNSRGSRLYTVLKFAFTILGITSDIAAQSNPPIRELTAIESASPERFGNIFGARELSAGHVLVNDGIRHQLIELDAKLARVRIILDSVAVGGNGYGPTASPLIRYLGDSTLFVDGTAQALLVIDPNGNVVRVMAGPSRADLRFLAGSPSGVDDKGRLVYRVTVMEMKQSGLLNSTFTQTQQLPDSASIVRLDLDTRKIDTVGKIKQQSKTKATRTRTADGKFTVQYLIDPLETLDEWAVTSNGVIAFVRGYDYHIDFLHSDGATSRSPKLAFDWRKLDDDDKRHFVDSVRIQYEKMRADAERYGDDDITRMMREMLMRYSAGFALILPKPTPKTDAPLPAIQPKITIPASQIAFVPPSELADYYPPVHGGSALPDLDGNLWILPNTSKQSKAGELVYDVVNDRGVLTQRVRVPAGRSIAGFGKHGVVYLMSIDGKHGWKLERAKIGS
ncbi:MAG: hypothetical protein ABJC26_07355 [Gemmatimonadaceae bacterium]